MSATAGTGSLALIIVSSGSRIGLRRCTTGWPRTLAPNALSPVGRVLEGVVGGVDPLESIVGLLAEARVMGKSIRMPDLDQVQPRLTNLVVGCVRPNAQRLEVA
jgi:hypothetical protein